MHNCHTAADVAANGLCSGCGICVGTCPYRSLEMIKSAGESLYIPVLKESKYCRGCRFCIDICPGHSVDLNKLSRFVFGRTSDDVLLGNHIDLYIGHSANKQLRWNSSSGGPATCLLIFALEEGIIDYAVVARMNRRHPLEPEVFIAQTAEEVISASKSKYCPVPTGTVIRDVLDANGKFGVVGLPCHIQGIRKAEMHNRKLRDKIVLHIGLFCSHTVDFLGTEFLLSRMNVRIEDVARIDYRGQGWPGGMTIWLKDGNKKFSPLSQYWASFFEPFFFTPKYCAFCWDLTNELADISLGDAWLPEMTGSKSGESIIITRTQEGDRILRQAISMKRVLLTRTSRAKVIQSQRNMLVFKKANLKARVSLLKWLGAQTPEYDVELPRPRATSYVFATIPYLSISISSSRTLRHLLRNTPSPLLKLYKRLVHQVLMLGSTGYLRK